ncbi:MAG: diguanylate cyclase [Sulfurimonas sp.]|nr:diguanylate cyclase [Sulfurimonas sp.]
MLSVFIVVAWIFLELVFLSIAFDAQNNYLNAHFSVEKIEEVWLKFYGVSALFTLLTLLLLGYVRIVSKKVLGYENLTYSLEDKLKSQGQKLELALEASGLGYWCWNINTGKHEVDTRWLTMLGLHVEDILHTEKDWLERIHPNDREEIISIIENAMQKQIPYVIEFRMLHFDGHYVWIQGSGSVTKVDKNGKPVELSGTHQDITKRKELEEIHIKNSLYLETLFEQNPNIIIVTDGVKLVRANGAFFKFFDSYVNLDTFLQDHSCICDFFEAAKFGNTITNEDGKWLESVFKTEEPLVKILRLGEKHYFAVYAKKIYDDASTHTMVTFSDITETYKLRHKFEMLSILDALTNAYNRRHFNMLFPQELNRAKRAGLSFCFAILDVDNFKLYNDTYGHDQGDVVLHAIAETLMQGMQRSNEFFFRLGGEEFGVLFSGYSEATSLEYAQNICKKITDLAIEHRENEPYGCVSVSVGICYVEAPSKAGIKEIYSKADKALYTAKESGRNRALLDALF